MKLSITCDEFKPFNRNSLRGFAIIRIDEIRMTIRDVAIHQKGDARWAQLPSKPMIDKNGAALRDNSTGKIQYVPIMEFDGRDVRDAFSQAVVAAILKREPRAFEDAAA